MDTGSLTPGDFLLDPRLARDTFVLGESSLSRILLARDARWPWIILVPRRVDVSELHELAPMDCQQLINEIATVSETLKTETGCLKINVATIGNIVRQLHVHIVARNEADPAWPGPIWGHGTPLSRIDDALPSFAQTVSERLQT